MLTFRRLLVSLLFAASDSGIAQQPSTAAPRDAGVALGNRLAGLFVYDSLQDRLVVYGGYLATRGAVDPTNPDPKTYAWTANGWSVIATMGPRSRDEVAFGYDGRDGSILMFGGRGEGNTRDSLGRTVRIPFRETWRFAKGSWTLVDSTGPNAQASPQGAFDAARGKFVVFGGRIQDANGRRFPSETWEWDGQRWSRFDAPGPPGRSGHVMAYDPKAKRIVLHGGSNGPTPLTDTWLWDGQRWELAASDGPRSLYGAATAGIDSGIVMFGGHTMGSVPQTTWYWTGRSWQIIANDGPRGRTFNVLTTDRRHRRIYLLGGTVEGGGDFAAPYPELWYLDESNHWIRVS